MDIYESYENIASKEYDYLENSIENKHDDFQENKHSNKMNELDDKHNDTLELGDKAEKMDKKWMRDKGHVLRLNDTLNKKQQYYNTYLQSIESSKMLYNRERHKTMMLGIFNVIMLVGVGLMWI